MGNSGDENITNRNSLFAKAPSSILSKPGISSEYAHEQLLLLTRLTEKLSNASLVNPDSEPTKLGLKTMFSCKSAVSDILNSSNPELVDNSLGDDNETPGSSHNP